MKLIKNIQIYAPENLGVKDVLISDSKIEKIDNHIELSYPIETMDGTGCILTPGLIDRHVHITGGGGEAGFISRARPIDVQEILDAGITTVIGLLGTDGYTRSTKELFAKAKELTQKGVHTYILTGSYAYPSNTLTSSMEDDIVFIDSILGVKLALSDHRSSHVTEEELTRLASKIRTASLIAGKQANLTIHMGDEKQALDLVFNILEKADIPVSLFQPTHCTRNPHLFEEAKRFTDMGGTIDITCDGNGKTLSYIQQIKNTEKVTISSDAQGSWSTYNEDGSVKEIGITPISNLKKEFIYLKNELGYENALPFFTKNVANVLGFKHIGQVKEGFDCDLVIWKEDQIQKVITKKQALIHSVPLLFIKLLNELYNCHWSCISTTDTCFYYTSVSTITICICWSNFIE